MNLRIRFPAVVSVTAFVLLNLGTATAPAQDSPLAKPLRKFDKDKDGKLTGDELVLARQSFNRGGKPPELSADRWKEMMQRRKNDWKEKYRKDLDSNNDGNLDDGEKQRMEQIWTELEKEYEKLRQEILRKYDKNDDGDLTQGERDGSRKESEIRRQEIDKRIMEAHRPKDGAAKPAP